MLLKTYLVYCKLIPNLASICPFQHILLLLMITAIELVPSSIKKTSNNFLIPGSFRD